MECAKDGGDAAIGRGVRTNIVDKFSWLFYDSDLELYGCAACHLAFGTVDSVRTHIKSKNSPHDPTVVLNIETARKIKAGTRTVNSLRGCPYPNQTSAKANWAKIFKIDPLESLSDPKPFLPAVTWLALHDGFACPLCRFYHRSADAVETHMQKCHATEWRTRQAALRVQVKPQLVQTLFLGKSAKFLPVVLQQNKSYWFSGGMGERLPAQGAAKQVATVGTTPVLRKTFDEIAALCKDRCLDGTFKRRHIFDALAEANSACTQEILCDATETVELGFNAAHTHSVFLALSRFDLTLVKCGFQSFQQVPTKLADIQGDVGSDASFTCLKQDINAYLSLCGRMAVDSAPFIREMVQLTGYAGSSVRKFKSVEKPTLSKYSTYIAQLLLVVVRTFSNNSSKFPKDAGKKMFPSRDHSKFEKITNSYLSSLSKPAPERAGARWRELSELIAALVLVALPGERPTDSFPLRQLLALLSVKKEDSMESSRGEEYFSDAEDDEDDRNTAENKGAWRFKNGSEMSHLLASILYCASCTSIYMIRNGGIGSDSKVEFVKSAVSLTSNTAVALVRDLLDKTSGDRNSDSSGIRFSLCLENSHSPHACGVLDGFHLSLATVRHGLVDMENELEQILKTDLLLTLDVSLGFESSIINDLRDRHTDPRVGFSFLEMPENHDMAQVTSEAVLEHIISGVARRGGWAVDNTPVSAGDQIRKFFILQSEATAANSAAVGILRISGEAFFERSMRYYLQSCQRFLQLILVYAHVAGGGPPRCTEICTLRHRNGAFDKRNLFIDHALFCFFHRYNKTRNITEKQYCIARFLPKKVSNLLLVYLTYVRPLENLFTLTLLKEGPQSKVPRGELIAYQQNQNEYIFVAGGNIYSASKVREVIFREFQRLGFSLNASQWRQYQTGMEREYMQILCDQSGDGSESHDPNCPFVSIKQYPGKNIAAGDPTQAGHSRRRAELSYARTAAVPRGIGQTAYMRHRANSINWHNLLGICCDTRRAQRIRCRAASSSRNSNGGSANIDERRTPCAPIDIPNLAKDIAHHLESLTPSKRGCWSGNVDGGTNTNMSAAPEKKKQRIEGPSAAQVCLDGGRDCSTGNCHHQELELYQEYIPYLKAMTANPHARFRSRYQLCALATALHAKRDMLLVLGTGSGKTLIYLLAAYIEGERARKTRTPAPLTIVVVPTRSLVQDILKRCTSMGVKAVSWKKRGTSPIFEDATVIVLAVEQVLMDDYAPFLENMRSEGRLARIVSEECHLMIQWQHFRPRMNQIRFRILGNSRVAIPVIMATATVSPEMERRVVDAHGVDHCRLSIIREPTYRSNIAYSVLFTNKSAIGNNTETDKMTKLAIENIAAVSLDCAQSAIKSTGERVTSDVPKPKDMRVLIYCPTKDLCRKVGNALGNYAGSSGLNWLCAQYTADLCKQDKDDVFKFWVEETEATGNSSSSSASADESARSEAFFVPKARGARTRIVVATSAFGTGIDVPDVRLVIHIGFARGLDSFAQESGRVGRDGLRARSIVIFSSRYFDGYTSGLKERTLKNMGVEESAELSGIQDFAAWALDLRRCRRKALFSYLDSAPPPSCLLSRHKDNNVAMCDCCTSTVSLDKAGIYPTYRGVESTPTLIASAKECQESRAECDDAMVKALKGPSGIGTALQIGSRVGYFSVDRTDDTSKQKMKDFMRMARALKDTCAICLVENLRRHSGRESCLPQDACFNCLARGRIHNSKECPIDFATLRKMAEPSCQACGLNTCLGTRLHQPGEWNWRGSCPYRSIIEMFLVAWRSPLIRKRLCEALDRAQIYVLPEDHTAFTANHVERELSRFIWCILRTVPGEKLPNIVHATKLLFETIGYVFTF